jgi:hypothetical protein
MNKAQLIALGIGSTALCIAVALCVPIVTIKGAGIDWSFTFAGWIVCITNVFNSDFYKDPTMLLMMALFPILPVLIISATGVAIFLLRKPKA